MLPVIKQHFDEWRPPNGTFPTLIFVFTTTLMAKLWNRSRVHGITMNETQLTKRPQELVSRSTMVIRVQKFCDNAIQGYYFTVVGPKGAGKSTIVQQAVKGRRGVLYVDVLPQDQDIYVGIRKALRAQGINMPDLTSIEFEELVRGKNLTVVFDVNRDVADNKFAHAQAAMIHQLASKKIAHTVVLLDNHKISFGKNVRGMIGGNGTLYVDDFSEAEAIEFLGKRGCWLSPHRLDELFKTVGTRAWELDEFVKTVMRDNVADDKLAKDFIASRSRAAKMKVQHFLKLDSRFAALLKAMIANGGVLDAANYTHLTFADVDSKMTQQSEAIAFEGTTGRWQFYSTAERVAAAELCK